MGSWVSYRCRFGFFSHDDAQKCHAFSGRITSYNSCLLPLKNPFKYTKDTYAGVLKHRVKYVNFVDDTRPYNEFKGGLAKPVF